MICSLILTGCPASFVSPYNESLYTETNAFYKNVATVIQDAKSVSPLKDEDRALITEQNAPNHEGHFSKFESKYNKLIIDSNALILSSMTDIDNIDTIGNYLNGKINSIIADAIPSICNSTEFSELGEKNLTVQNYVDLKCIISKLKQDHKDSVKGIMKKANFEQKDKLIFNAILAIQKAESFKNKK
ncbi:hypothetical protein [Methylomonas sp. UP202]|uniref:hypothetical protein n=1 Tax=Methylomonas sp. UP202 TaxID=3040943 RepID=UPI002479A1DE|nr:hypothetical protein [Methylomonas sp. UP202]WGS87629.1 hypothetical protein QC632_07675 [Methylomonas sp. UP202]